MVSLHHVALTFPFLLFIFLLIFHSLFRPSLDPGPLTSFPFPPMPWGTSATRGQDLWAILRTGLGEGLTPPASSHGVSLPESESSSPSQAFG